MTVKVEARNTVSVGLRGSAIVLIAVELAACASSNVTGEDDDLHERYDGLLVDINMIEGQLTADGGIVPAAVLPTSGGATYAGLATIWSPGGPSLGGGGEITADFAARTLDGSLGDFVGPLAGDDHPETTAAMAGELSVTGVIGATDPAISATVAGELTGAGQVIGVNATLTGNFWDADGAYGESVDPDAMILSGAAEVIVNGVSTTGGGRFVSY